MDIYYSIEEYAATGSRSHAALGFFDGVHLGHRAVIDACCADRGAARAVVLTFCESPAAALGAPVPPTLTDNARKAALLAAAGADAVIFADFDALRLLSPTDFVRKILRDALRAEKVFCGYNYRFGKGGAGDAAALARLCAAEGIAARTAAPVVTDGEAVSSTRIRALLAAGEIEAANRLLGSPFAVCGTFDSGNHIGTSLGYPTANLSFREGLCVPRHGVYAARVTVGGRCYRAATNIGVHPTVGESSRPLCESFLLDYAGDALYGRQAECELLSFLRPERRFASFDALQEQVMRDVEAVKERAN